MQPDQQDIEMPQKELAPSGSGGDQEPPPQTRQKTDGLKTLLLEGDSARLLKAGFHRSTHWAHPLAALVAFSLDVIKPAYPHCPGWVAGSAIVAILVVMIVMKFWKEAREIGAAIIAFFVITTVLSGVVIAAEAVFGGEGGSVAERVPYLNDAQKHLGIDASLSVANRNLVAKLAGVKPGAIGTSPAQQQITYESQAEADRTRVTYRLPYLDLVRKGGPVSGLTYDRDPFDGELPGLLVTIENNTSENIIITAIYLNIKSNQITREPIPVFDDLSQDCLRISNQGWADIVNPILRFAVSRDTGMVVLTS